jgi:uncharacterized membrane protein
MMHFRTEETIARPAHEIWAYAADILEHPKWMAVTDPRILSGSSTEVGSRGREKLRVAGRRYDAEFEVTAAEPGRRLTWRGVSGAPFELELTLELEPVNDTETRASYFGTVQPKGLWRLLEPLMTREARKGPEAELRRLKEILEARPALQPAGA